MHMVLFVPQLSYKEVTYIHALIHFSKVKAGPKSLGQQISLPSLLPKKRPGKSNLQQPDSTQPHTLPPALHLEVYFYP